MLNIAAFLDPCFRSLSFLSDEERSDVIEAVEDEAVLLNIPTDSQEPSLEEPPQKRHKGEEKLFSLFDDLIQPACLDPMEKTKVEVRRYSTEEPVNESQLEWWKMNCSRFPILTLLARKYLAIPATSVPSERVFSTARACG